MQNERCVGFHPSDTQSATGYAQRQEAECTEERMIRGTDLSMADRMPKAVTARCLEGASAPLRAAMRSPSSLAIS